jgi:hypothetical protein
MTREESGGRVGESLKVCLTRIYYTSYYFRIITIDGMLNCMEGSGIDNGLVTWLCASQPPLSKPIDQTVCLHITY